MRYPIKESFKNKWVRQCSYCGEEVILTKQRYDRENIFCNKQCEGLFKTKEPNVRCYICKKPFAVKQYRLNKLVDKKQICCSRACLAKLKKITTLGKKNPNYKHEKDLSMFYNLTNDGAYILGLIWADGSLKETEVAITQNSKGVNILNDISKLIFGSTKNVIKNKTRDDMYTFNIYDKEFINYMLSLGGINIGKKSHNIEMPNIPEDKKWPFICGYFDGDGGFKYNYRYPEINISSCSSKMLKQVAEYWNVNYTGKTSISASGFKALDICGKMYESCSLHHDKKHYYYLDILNWEPFPNNGWVSNECFKYKKLDPRAVDPYKKRVTDIGYDVSAIAFNVLNEKANLYMADTRLAIQPVPGHYFDLVGRSSLAVNGYQFALGVGIIDRSYVGSLKMPIILLPGASIPELPFRCGQLILRKAIHAVAVEVSSLDAGSRGTGGFGSTGK